MRVALVHDYLNEYGGAERVLEALSEIWPDAPIYTAFYRGGSAAYERFKHRHIITSWVQHIPGFAAKLHSPLRFLAPQIWESFDFTGFDVVVSSASWYITKGIITPPNCIHICYCHTPPRYLYGYDTSINWRKYWPVRVYALIVNKYLRQYDFEAAQKVDFFIANSKNTQSRIKKFYRRDSVVIYPPVDITSNALTNHLEGERSYFLIISRLVGGKGLSFAVEAANRLQLPLKVVGTGAGWSHEEQHLKAQAGPTVEFLGYVPDERLYELYRGAKAFLALARDEDFGITPVEAMLAGTPIIAYRGGGYLETVVENKTGVFIDELTTDCLVKVLQKFETLNFSLEEIKHHAQKFSKSRFQHEIKDLIKHRLPDFLSSNLPVSP